MGVRKHSSDLGGSVRLRGWLRGLPWPVPASQAKPIFSHPFTPPTLPTGRFLHVLGLRNKPVLAFHCPQSPFLSNGVTIELSKAGGRVQCIVQLHRCLGLFLS